MFCLFRGHDLHSHCSGQNVISSHHRPSISLMSIPLHSSLIVIKPNQIFKPFAEQSCLILIPKRCNLNHLIRIFGSYPQRRIFPESIQLMNRYRNLSTLICHPTSPTFRMCFHPIAFNLFNNWHNIFMEISICLLNGEYDFCTGTIYFPFVNEAKRIV